MSTIKLTTAYQLIITALLFGACLGVISRQIPLALSTGLPTVSAMSIRESQLPTNLPQLVGTSNRYDDLALTTSEYTGVNRQIDATLHPTADTNGLAHAIDPDGSLLRTDTAGQGHEGVVTRMDGALPAAALPQMTNDGALPADFPIAIVNAELVNLRAAPALSAPIIGQAQAGQQMQIIGRDATNSWLFVCCVADRLVWVSAHVVTTYGDLTNISHISASVFSSAASSTAASGTSSAEVKTNRTDGVVPSLAPEQYEYRLVQQQQFGERIIPRIFLYVSSSSSLNRGEGIPHLGLLIKKDGRLLPMTERTHGGPPDFTWPLASPRRQLANLKLEFPQLDPVGHWEIQLIDSTGQPVGPAAHFDFGPDEPNLEMYLHYQQ